MSFSQDDDGRGHVRAELDADHFGVFDAALSAAKDRLHGDGQRDVDWVEALMEVRTFPRR